MKRRRSRKSNRFLILTPISGTDAICFFIVQMKTKSNFLFVSGLLCLTVFFACNRHTTSTADSFQGPVEGDTVAYFPTMNSKLREDSVLRTDAYYYRINRVKREEITDEDSKEVNEYDRFGNMLRQVHYLDGEMFWKNVDVYNRFGNHTLGVHTFYDNGLPDNIYTTKSQFEPDASGLGQRIVRTDMACDDTNGDLDKDYAYTFTYKGDLVDVETRFVDGKCTEKVYHTYNASNKLQQDLIIEFTTEGPDTTICTYTYDAQGREVNWSETSHGVLLNDHRTEYNSDGRTAKYSSLNYEPYLTITFEYFYLKNGLVSHVVTTYNGKATTAKYRYSYY